MSCAGQYVPLVVSLVLQAVQVVLVLLVHRVLTALRERRALPEPTERTVRWAPPVYPEIRGPPALRVLRGQRGPSDRPVQPDPPGRQARLDPPDLPGLTGSMGPWGPLGPPVRLDLKASRELRARLDPKEARETPV